MMPEYLEFSKRDERKIIWPRTDYANKNRKHSTRNEFV